VRRIHCRACGQVKTERLDFLADNPFYTKRFAWHVGRRCRQSSARDVAKEFKLDWHTVKSLDKQYMAEQLRRAGMPGPKAIGIDEISIRKGHTYRIVVSDLIRKRPIWFGGTDRSEASMAMFYEALGTRKSAGIRLAVMDMWKPFRNATHTHAPQAAILFDKFHIMAHLGQALDAVRKSEYARLSGKDRRYIKGQKYDRRKSLWDTLLAHRENLSLDGKTALKQLLAANKRLNTAYLLKESFGQLWDYRREAWARRFFDQWRQSLRWQRLKPFEKFADMIERHWDGIAAYCQPENKVSLGFVEGLTQQQDSRHPAPRLRPARRGVSAPESAHLHAAGAVKSDQSTHTISRRPKFFMPCGTAASTATRTGFHRDAALAAGLRPHHSNATA